MGHHTDSRIFTINKYTRILRKEGTQMKKSAKKKLSLLLAIVLLISMMPFAAFAAEDNGIAPCVICQHEYTYIYYDYTYTTNGSYTHKVTQYKYTACSNCDYVSLPLTSSFNESHARTNGVLVGHINGKYKYQFTCNYCGQVYTALLDAPIN